MADFRTQWKITGLKELAEFLKDLPMDLRRGVVRRALRKAALLVETDAKRRVPILKPRLIKGRSELDPRRTPGTLLNAIRTAGAFSPAGGTEVIVKVGVKRLTKSAVARFKLASGKGGAFNPNDPFYAMYVERGTSKTPVQAFMRPALESQGFAVVERFREEFRRGLDEFAKKLLLHKGRAASGA